ncbi:excisionase family DNA-binding protein [Limibaculum sp. M0105]|uniref:Excisionase family DNA-binding protein n=1 Tax=Thermohalobaculum xanthum TaxID=2753746 RepID=A0A8J7SHA5_9RHOB|nr:excisionase family DNA-binding protein [Thermohalobaculum xanthum]MBK0400632.1 excisionase family DNA-binding protein [Thermohalobaculum xanthum]
MQADLTIHEFAERLGVSHMTIRRRIWAGEIKSYRLGPSIVRIPYTELDRIRGGEAA